MAVVKTAQLFFNVLQNFVDTDFQYVLNDVLSVLFDENLFVSLTARSQKAQKFQNLLIRFKLFRNITQNFNVP